jgi:hypothetical protein
MSPAALRALKLDTAALREIIQETQKTAAEVLPLMIAA